MRRPASLLTVMFLSALFLPASSATEVGPNQRAVENDDLGPATSGAQSNLGGPNMVAGRHREDLRAVVRQGGELPDCWDGPMTLALMDGDRQVYTRTYCSEYGRGGGRLIRDAQGANYVLLEHSEGRGSHATRDYLTVYKFTDSLEERASLLVREPVDVTADMTLDYRIDTPSSGGIVLQGRWVFSGELSLLDAPPSSGSVRLEVDTSPPRVH